MPLPISIVNKIYTVNSPFSPVQTFPSSDFTYRSFILDILGVLYDKQSQVTALLESLASDDSPTLTIAFEPLKTSASGAGSYWINFDPRVVTEFDGGSGYINRLGEWVHESVAQVLAHEISHAISGTLDPEPSSYTTEGVDDLIASGADLVGTAIPFENSAAVAISGAGSAVLVEQPNYFSALNGNTGRFITSSLTDGYLVDDVIVRATGDSDVTDLRQRGATSHLVMSLGGDDKILAGEVNDWIYGGMGNDEINGGGGSDHIYTGADNDLVIGSAGNDAVDDRDAHGLLGGGIDLVKYGETQIHVTAVTIGAAVGDTSGVIVEKGTDGSDTLIGIEKIEFNPGETLTINRLGDLGGLNDGSQSVPAAHYHFDITGKTTATINIQGGSGTGGGSIDYNFILSELPSTLVPGPHFDWTTAATNVVQTFVIDPSAAESVRQADRIKIDGKTIDGPRVMGISANNDIFSRLSFDGVAGEAYYLLSDPLGGQFFELNIFVAGDGGRERIVIKHWREGDLGIRYQVPSSIAYNTPELAYTIRPNGDLLPGNLEFIRTAAPAHIAKVFPDFGTDGDSSASYGSEASDDIRMPGARNAIAYGGAGNDTLDASDSSANHVLVGGTGADLLIGGTGRDAASYLHADAAVTVNLTDPSIRAGEAVGDTLVSIENLVGSRYHDTLVGDAGDNRLSGQDGNDTLDGGGSVAGDTLYGGNGDDVLFGGAGKTGADQLFGGAGDDTLSGYGNDTLNGGLGSDSLVGVSGINTASYEGATQAVYVDLAAGTGTTGIGSVDILQNIPNAIGGDWNDSLKGDAGANALFGGVGRDSIAGMGGADTLDGGADYDTVSYEASAAAVVVDLGLEIVSGGDAEGDHLVSIEGVIGSTFADVLTGDAGNNVLNSGGGADTLSGGIGDDQFVVSELDAVVVEAADAGTDEILTSTSTYTLPENVEALRSAGQPNFVGTGNALNNTITGGYGHDSLFGGAGNDALNGLGGNDFLDGGDGDDTLGAGDGSATLYGGSGNDSLYASGGNNLLDGGAGDDTLSAGLGSATMYGGAGNDVFWQASGSNEYYGGEGNNSVLLQDKVYAVVNLATGIGTDDSGSVDSYSNIQNVAGTFRNDRITGDSQNNILYGGGGFDTIEGSAGADIIVGGQGNRALAEGFHSGPFASLEQGFAIGTATYASSTAAVSVNLTTGVGSGGDAEGDLLYFISDLIGGSGNDTLIGGVGDNSLAGGSGDDVLAGGDGSDTLDGGSGNNTASFADSPWAIQAYLDSGLALDNIHIDSQGVHTVTDTLISIRNLVGSDHADFLSGDANANVLSGGAGNDTIWGSSFYNTANDTIYGGAGIDTLVLNAMTSQTVFSSTSAGDIVVTSSAMGGSDTISGIEVLQFSDGVFEMNFLTGGVGDDTFAGTSAVDVVFGGAGKNTMSYATSSVGVGFDLLYNYGYWGAYKDYLSSIQNVIGSDFNDELWGDQNANVFTGNAGNDLIRADAGNDSIFGGAGSDSLYGGNDNDIVSGGSGTDSLFGLAGNDSLNGDDGSDELYGGTGNDTLVGGTGSDIISGASGIDTALFDGTYSDYSLVNLSNGNISVRDLRSLLGGGCRQRIHHCRVPPIRRRYPIT
jgi:Ca2+-binding RTX toxin-like protein